MSASEMNPIDSTSGPEDDAILAPWLALLGRHLARCGDAGEYLDRALPVLASAIDAAYLALVAAEAGRWSAVGEVGSPRRLPADLLGEAMDRERIARDGPWIAIPLAAQSAASEALLAWAAAEPDQSGVQALGGLATTLYDGLQRFRALESAQRRVRRLEAILEIAAQWNQAHEVEPLLVQMAEAATRLMACDRASIFLWDRRARTLVGRPALGMPGGELRIADDQGVVGQVIQEKRPVRVEAAVEPERINRTVDSQTGYKTRNLLCVPLRGRSGELFGAFELINKQVGPFTSEDEAALMELAAHASTALENAQDRQELLSTNRRMADQAAEGIRFLGNSPSIEAIRSSIRRVADTELAVLLLGENGTGKEVVAQSIHYLSGRRDKPFIALNCAAIPDTLAESELFGHERGAFTDARDSRPGKFELAAEGTLFLDEIGDLSPGIQAKLLRVLEERLIVRVGGSTPIHTGARVIAATNQNLAEMVHQKRFREDLFYRLNVVTLELPPLRARHGDVMLLAEHFLEDFCRKARRATPRFSHEARQRLEQHTWPGNVRELRNLMERVAYLSEGDVIESADLAFILSPRGRDSMTVDGDRPLSEATAQFQIEYIRRAVERAGGNMSQAAEQLGLHRSNLYRKMRQLGMGDSEK